MCIIDLWRVFLLIWFNWPLNTLHIFFFCFDRWLNTLLALIIFYRSFQGVLLFNRFHRFLLHFRWNGRSPLLWLVYELRALSRQLRLVKLVWSLALSSFTLMSTLRAHLNHSYILIRSLLRWLMVWRGFLFIFCSMRR